MAKALKKKQFNLRLTEELAKSIQETADQLGITTAELVRLAIKMQVNESLNPYEQDLVNEIKGFSMVSNNEKQ